MKVQIASIPNLKNAFNHIRSNRGGPGVDGISLEQFSQNLEKNLEQISIEILNDQYKAEPNLIVDLPNRSIAILTVKDRLISQAIAQIICHPIEKYLHKSSYAYRFGKSAIGAAKDLEKLLMTSKFPSVLRCDIYHFFDQMQHATLRQFLTWALSEKEISTIDLIFQSIQKPQLKNGQLSTRKIGVAQGSSLSPLLSNLYLTPFDRYLEKSGQPHLRFCDDLVILLSDPQQASLVLQTCEKFLDNYLQLKLHPQKTKILSFAQGFDFLGFHFCPQGRTPGKKAQKRLQERLENKETPQEKQQAIRQWQAYFGKEHNPDSTYPFLDLFTNLFYGNPNHFGKAYKGKRVGYTCIKKTISKEDLLEHLLGKQTLGIYPLYNDKVICTCLDIDICSNIMRTLYHTNAGEFSIYADRAICQARAIEKILYNFGFSPLLEESGFKGYHIWILLEEFTPAKVIIEFWKKILLLAGEKPKGIQREILPRESENLERLGTLIKLPLGIHPTTGCRSMFLDKEGENIANPHKLLATTKKASLKDMQKVMNKTLPPQNEIEKLICKCNTVRYLCQKAKKERHLGHFERTILLYTLGQFGEQGAKKIHEVIGQCDNYSRHYTQKQIEKKHPAPIGCRRIHEIMGEELNNIEPCCHFEIPGKGYASPILHVYPNATKNLNRRIP